MRKSELFFLEALYGRILLFVCKGHLQIEDDDTWYCVTDQ